ncbi:carbohydrate-binding module family 13 protein [Phanerochaete sordida]|uniref:Carbohydrate-binding module family 13 protein n=1 Tax=Phanerochaete sordida TaxID=48140 RepID=A0A9P3LLG8_9APHY|nr:carbohydrate-binding module family 13 protein [Phanerochaete sordida]
MVNVINDGAIYKFVNAGAGNVCETGPDGESVVGFDWNGRDTQMWKVAKLPESPGYVIQNVGTGRYLSICEGAQEGIRVMASAQPTQWEIRPDWKEPSLHRLYLANTDYNIDLSDHGNPTPGTPCAIWSAWEGRNQCWHLDEVA